MRIELGDDDRVRYVVTHYAYDPARRERRYRVVAVFDNEVEFEEHIAAASAQLQVRRATRDDVDP